MIIFLETYYIYISLLGTLKALVVCRKRELLIVPCTFREITLGDQGFMPKLCKKLFSVLQMPVVLLVTRLQL